MEHSIRSLANFLMRTRQVTRHIFDEVLLLTWLTTKDLPEAISLDIVLVRNGELLSNDSADPFLMFLAGFDGLVLQGPEARRVVRVSAVVAVDIHVAVSVEGAKRVDGTVDGNLLVVSTETMTVGIRVGEETRLQDWVRGGFDARDHVGRRERGLLDFGEVVLGVFVEGEFAEATEGHFTLRPDFCEVEDVPAEFLGLFGAQGLDVAGPGRALASLDGAEQVLGVPVGVFGGEFGCFFVCE